jgi:queuine tRNA-ribosyltransferase
MLGARLNTLHNLHYYQWLMREMRQAIEQRKFAEFVTCFKTERQSGTV